MAQNTSCLESAANYVQFYAFSSNLPVATSISSFTVLVNLVGGTTETYDNNGAGYPISDSVVVLTPQSCYSGGNLTVVAAVSNFYAVTEYFAKKQGTEHCYYSAYNDCNAESKSCRRFANCFTTSKPSECLCANGARCFFWTIQLV